MVRKLQQDGTVAMSCLGSRQRQASVDALDLENLEWRGTDLQNSWLIGEEDSTEFVMVNSLESECCHVFGISQKMDCDCFVSTTHRRSNRLLPSPSVQRRPSRKRKL